MKKLILLVTIFFVTNLAHGQDKDKVDSHVSILLNGGMDVDIHTKKTSGFGGFGLQFPLGPIFFGIGMEGKHTFYRMLDDTTQLIQKFYTLNFDLGYRVSYKYNPHYAGTGFGISCVVLWDNFKIKQEFPVGFGPIIQIQRNYNGDKINLGGGIRGTYLIIPFQTNPQIQGDKLKNVPAVNVELFFVWIIPRGEKK